MNQKLTNPNMRLVKLLPLICSLSACTTSRVTPPIAATHFNRAEVLNYISSHSAGIVFVSHNGRMYGTDSDARITLTRNNQIEVTKFEDTVQTYKGTYFVEASGAIHTSLRRYPAKWPIMYLGKDRRGAVLFHNDQDLTSRLGRREGGAAIPQAVPYWPFRQTR